MLANNGLSPELQLIAASIWLILSIIMLGLSIWRFDWLKKHFPRMLRWGFRSFWNYPASRYGFAAGCLLGISLGIGPVGSYFDFIHPSTWRILIIIAFAHTIVAAIYDFRLHRRSGDKAGQ